MKMICRYFIAVMVITQPLFAITGTFGTYTISKESKVWIEGSSTVNQFTCLTYNVQGIGILDTAKTTSPVIGAPMQLSCKAEFAVSVKSMDCGNRMMNNDMYEALKSDEHNLISYQLKQVRILNTLLGDQLEAMTQGILIVAGSPQTIHMKVRLKPLGGGKYSIEGHKDVTMTSFGVKPPTAMMGLIKAHDRLTFHFNIVVE
ncbi:MAG: hypothetical protein ACO3GR_00900 [Candidatus Kapaibacteriota bacterium]